jgi:phenylacetic acid degradation operon negative regulatory protein
MPKPDWIAAISRDMRLNAAAFIVTVYGDIVVPRGGVLWTGTLIELCARVGINESLVRTAVSRLVAAHQLQGERVGRRSYYRLDASARAVFDQAAGLLYGPDMPVRGWQVLHIPGLTPDEGRRLRMGHMGGPVFLRPDRGQAAPSGAILLHAAAPDDPAPLAQFWDLSSLQQGYEAMLARFLPLDAALPARPLADADADADADALVARLLLVHAYRHVLLRDPRLPPPALPRGWKGQEARALFRRLYLRLTPGTERHIAARLLGEAGPLPARTAESAARLAGMA